MATDNEKKLHTLMYTLLYPAVLGTMIVGLVFALEESRIVFGYGLFFAIFLIFYFSSQHVENASDQDSYLVSKFIFDIFEVACIFGLFLLLNVYKFKYSIENNLSAWNWFYLLLIVAILIPVFSRKKEKGAFFEKKDGKGQSILSIIAALITASGFICNNNFLILAGLTVVFLMYLIFFVFGVKIPSINKENT